MNGHRILALVTDAFGGYGGIAQYNRDFITALAANASVDSVEVFPRLAPGKLEELPQKVRQSSEAHNKIAYALSAVGVALRFRPTIVFCGHLYHGTLAAMVAQLTGAKLISQLHGTEIWGDVSPSHLRPIEVSNLVLTVSRDTRGRVLSKARIDPSKVVVLNNTVGRDFTPGDRAAARARFLLDDEFAILTVSRLDARGGYKGHDRIIPLIKELSAAAGPVVYLIAGIGDDRPRLEELVRLHGLETQVRFLGKVSRVELPDLYRAADLFALPSTGEGFGISFLEAMACGTPSIGLAIGGVPDALCDGELGWCVVEADFPSVFLSIITAARGDRISLSKKVQERFGYYIYIDRVTKLLTFVQ